MMMGFAAILASFNTTQDAAASFNPNWNRPILTADMEVVEATGDFARVNEASLTLTRKDGSGEIGFNLNLDGDHYRLALLSTPRDFCGSAIYLAIQVEAENTMPIANGRALSLELRDHSDRHCRDYFADLWEATVTLRDADQRRLIQNGDQGNQNDERSKLELRGTAQPVMTILQ